MPVESAVETIICRHFGICGGCHCPLETADGPRPLPYREELAAKETRVRELLRPFDVGEWGPLVPSPDPWHYRNKMEYAFGREWGGPVAGENRALVLGLRQAGRFDRLVDVETCRLMSEDSLELLNRVRRWGLAEGLTGYDRRRHEGDLRYLVLREGKNTGERLALLLAHKRAESTLDEGRLAGFSTLR